MRRFTIHTEVAGSTMQAGTLTVRGFGDQAISDFLYDPEYMYAAESYDLAPAVKRTVGDYTTAKLPYFVQDAGPDRWGAHLITRAFEANQVGRHPDDLDAVTAASDLTRQGALRFADEDGNWQGDGTIPTHVDLAELLRAADEVSEDTERFSAYAALLRTGTSALGGARPKASVTDTEGNLWIAKFPMAQDRWNVPVWEKTALDLAANCGIAVPETQLVNVAGRQVLLVKRFDRDGQTRIPYLSMRTMLSNPDDGSRPPDYRDIATVLRHNAGQDLTDLFRRTTFSVLINNTDDHLRNHGVLRAGGRWTLAPLFDVNPEQDAGRARHTAIHHRSGLVGVVAALIDLGRYCGLAAAAATAEISQLREQIERWHQIAEANGADPRELDRFTRTFTAVHDAVDQQLRTTKTNGASRQPGRQGRKPAGQPTGGQFSETSRQPNDAVVLDQPD